LRKRHLFLPAALLALALGLAACGGGGGESDEEKIETTIETSATSTDPANCAKYSTLKFMEQTSSGQGAEAEKDCEEEAEEAEGKPESVSVSNVEIEGEEATADAAFEGGNFDGQTLTVALVEEEGDWKLNELVGFANFDAAKLIDALVQQLEAEGSAKPKLIACVAEGLRELDESEFEELVINQDTQPIVEIAEACE
jgi:ABC-type glycerol-3-phosphate transport system substrate-binding protein